MASNRPSRHLEQAGSTAAFPGGDHEGFIDAHVRRLEALCAGLGSSSGSTADHWRLPRRF